MKEHVQFVASFLDNEYHIALLRMNIAAHKTALSIQQTFEKANASLNASFSRIGVQGFAAGAVVALGSIAKAGDDVVTSLARISAVTGDESGAAGVLEKLREVIGQTGADAKETVGQFTRFSIAARQIGATNDEVIKLIELVQKAGVISGSTSSELSAGATQLGQALASGRFQGDELRSIMENMPILAETLANNLGVSIGQLREMGKEGQLTTDVVFPALLNSADQLNAKFEKMPITMARSWSIFKSSLTQGLAGADKFADKLLPIMALIPGNGLSDKTGFALRALAGAPEEMKNWLMMDAKTRQTYEEAMGNQFNPSINRPGPKIPGLNAPFGSGGDQRTKEELKAAEALDAELKKMNEESVREHEKIAELQRKADAEAIDRMQKMMEVNQRHNEALRQMHVDSLQGEAKIKALEQDRATLKDQIVTAGEDEKAQIQDQINQKEIQIAQEKRLQKIKEQERRAEVIHTALEKEKANLQALQEQQLNLGLMGPDGRRQAFRDDQDVKREMRRTKRMNERGTQEARFGMAQTQKEIGLTQATIADLAKQLAALIPK